MSKKFKSIGTHWIGLYVNGNNIVNFDSFGVKQIIKETKIFIENKNIITNTFRIQAYDWIIHGYFCIGFFLFYVKS